MRPFSAGARTARPQNNGAGQRPALRGNAAGARTARPQNKGAGQRPALRRDAVGARTARPQDEGAGQRPALRYRQRPALRGGLNGWRARGRVSALVLAVLGIAIPGSLGAKAPEPPHAVAPASGAVLSSDPRFVLGEVLASDDFTGGLDQWRVEREAGGTVTARGRALEIDVPAGCTVWFRRPFSGPVLIAYEATVIDAGGPNDRVSDLNCFWMATDARNPGDLFAVPRSGKFQDYDQLRCYYVGVGGNGNTTTRFRRYVGQSGNRPLLPEHDLSAPEFLLEANKVQHIQLIAAGPVIEFCRDGRRLFALDDPQPYTNGWFAFRTVHSHLRIRAFRVYRLEPRQL